MVGASGGSRAGTGADPARMWRVADLGGLELFRATISEFEFRPHAHEEFFLALTEDGLARPTYRGGSHVVGPDDVIALNPEEAHAGGPPAESSWSYRALYPGPELFGRIVAEFPGDRPGMPAFGADVVRDRRVVDRLRRFHLLSESVRANRLEREECLVEALVLLVTRHSTPARAPGSPGREPGAVRRSREYLHEHLDRNVTLEALAAFAGLSPFHLSRVFRSAVGMPPHAYQTSVRVRRAKSLIRAGLPITVAAAEAGFYDQAHLNRHFKRILGLSPGRYARDAAGG
ncbi:helix-turn-helix domain-containing protein [Plantactinospora sp. WMMB782]|uniref:AraC family transcriptional regulator n=1 Tax=Plantactinospora sp. WMMB782 TaxID=3404121 RepID=UPI003B94BA99